MTIPKSERSPSLLVVHIDGLARNEITRSTMPALTTLALEGASTLGALGMADSGEFCATEMIRGVDSIETGASYLHVARHAGWTTAAFITASSADRAIEPDAVDIRHVIDDNAGPVPRRIALDGANVILGSADPVVVFVEIAALAGPDDRQPEDVDGLLSRVFDAAGGETSVLVVSESPTDAVISSLTLRVPDRVAPAQALLHAGGRNVVPTIADVLGLDWANPAEASRETMSLLGAGRPITEHLLGVLDATAAESYGERVTMLDHALQSAALAAADDAGDELTLACLLHDIGHVLGDAGEWGLPDHAAVGAEALAPVLAPAIVEPIRHHVTAKRHRVGVDPTYHDRLSQASQMSLAEQGGPLDASASAEFAALPFADEAMRLRAYDDDGKVDGLDIPPADSYRRLLEGALVARRPIDAAWARDACRCADCRHPSNDQHLIDATSLAGWTVVRTDHLDGALDVTLHHASGERHRCHIPAASGRDFGPLRWTSSLGAGLRAESTDWQDDHGPFVEQLARRGIALFQGCGVAPGTVLEVGNTIGHVRSTNYGDLFDVIAEPDPVNLAYTPLGLPAHTDNPYRDPCPTVQLLHCIDAAEDGGASRFVDGLTVAEHLREHDRESFDLLTSVEVTFRYHGDAEDLRARRPLIDVHNDGEIMAISVNNRSMEPLDVGDPRSARFYRAYARFVELLDRDDFAIEITLRPGELVAFDNRRVLHGRRAFRATERRHLQGCYIDIDAIWSAARRSTASAPRARQG